MQLSIDTTPILQPFDVCVSRTLKANVKNAKINFYQEERIKNIKAAISKTRIETVLNVIDAWNRVSPGLCQQGFAKSGSYPFNAQAPLNNKCLIPSGNAKDI